MKSSFVSRIMVCALAGALGVAFIGCGDDESFVTRSSTLPTKVADKAELETYECSDDIIGEKVYVTELEEKYECDGEKWFKSDDQTKPSSSFTKSSSSKKTDGSSSSGTTDSSRDSGDEKIAPAGTYDCSRYKCVTTEYLNPDLLESGKYGEFLDERDGQVYRTIQIGDQVWMAQNLNFDAIQSSCYHDSLEYCETNGRLYTWSGAMDTARVFTTNAKGCGYDRLCDPEIIYPAQGVCPEGWHVPDNIEWETLRTAIKGTGNSLNELKSQTGWKKNGFDVFGFSAIKFKDDVYTSFWVAKETHYETAKIRFISEASDLTERKKNGTSHVRCIKGQAQKDTTWTENSYKVMPSGTYDCSKYDCITTEYLNQEMLEAGKYGEVLDDRDGQVYKTIQIGNQVWMAQNLNYERSEGDYGGDSYCYNDEPDSCTTTGRLYTWYLAKHVCPVRWHLPTNEEWQELFDFVGDTHKLLSEKHPYGNFLDEYGFSARLGRTRKGSYSNVTYGEDTHFWSASGNSGNTWSARLKSFEGLNTTVVGHLNIRCIEGEK